MTASSVTFAPSPRFPVLRAAPLWRQTWVERGWERFDEYSDAALCVGYWFPPFRCGPNGFGDRKKLVGPPARERLFGNPLWRLYSSPGCRCSDCLTAADAVEIMLVGIAQSVAAWPEDAEHRCWFDDERGDCSSCDAAQESDPSMWAHDLLAAFPLEGAAHGMFKGAAYFERDGWITASPISGEHWSMWFRDADRDVHIAPFASARGADLTADALIYAIEQMRIRR